MQGGAKKGDREGKLSRDTGPAPRNRQPIPSQNKSYLIENNDPVTRREFEVWFLNYPHRRYPYLELSP